MFSFHPAVKVQDEFSPVSLGFSASQGDRSQGEQQCQQWGADCNMLCRRDAPARDQLVYLQRHQMVRGEMDPIGRAGLSHFLE